MSAAWQAANARRRKPARIAVAPAARGSRAARGLTLVESLLVIAIIALLSALLTPVLSRTRAAAQQTVCENQLRRWGLAFEIYAGATGYYPHADGLDRQTADKPTRPQDWADYFGWIDVLPPLWGERRWRDYAAWQHPRVDTAFQCPAARAAPDELYRYRPSRDGFFSYAMNACLELDENCRRHPEDTTGPMPSFLRVDLLRSPARVVLLFDQLLDPQYAYHGAQSSRDAGRHCGEYPRAFSARHAKTGGKLGGSILYGDCHVQWKDSVWRSRWPDGLEAPPRDDLDWYPF